MDLLVRCHLQVLALRKLQQPRSYQGFLLVLEVPYFLQHRSVRRVHSLQFHLLGLEDRERPSLL